MRQSIIAKQARVAELRSLEAATQIAIQRLMTHVDKPEPNYAAAAGVGQGALETILYRLRSMLGDSQ